MRKPGSTFTAQVMTVVACTGFAFSGQTYSGQAEERMAAQAHAAVAHAVEIMLPADRDELKLYAGRGSAQPVEEATPRNGTAVASGMGSISVRGKTAPWFGAYDPQQRPYPVQPRVEAVSKPDAWQPRRTFQRRERRPTVEAWRTPDWRSARDDRYDRLPRERSSYQDDQSYGTYTSYPYGYSQDYRYFGQYSPYPRYYNYPYGGYYTYPYGSLRAPFLRMPPLRQHHGRGFGPDRL